MTRAYSAALAADGVQQVYQAVLKEVGPPQGEVIGGEFIIDPDWLEFAASKEFTGLVGPGEVFKSVLPTLEQEAINTKTLLNPGLRELDKILQQSKPQLEFEVKRFLSLEAPVLWQVGRFIETFNDKGQKVIEQLDQQAELKHVQRVNTLLQQVNQFSYLEEEEAEFQPQQETARLTAQSRDAAKQVFNCDDCIRTALWLQNSERKIRTGRHRSRRPI